MRVTTRDGDSEVTSDVTVEGPRVVLYDHQGRALRREIGFRPAGIDQQKSLDNPTKTVIKSTSGPKVGRTK